MRPGHYQAFSVLLKSTLGDILLPALLTGKDSKARMVQ